MVLLGKWAERDGPAAMKYAEEHARDAGIAGGIMKMSAAASWAETDPDAVWAWYKENKDEGSGGILGGNHMILSTIFSSLMANDPDAAFERLDELDAEARTMALAGMCQSALFDDAKRQRMLETIDGMPEGTEKTNARQMLLSQWAMFAPEDAAAWVAKQPPAAQKDLRETMGGMLIMTDPKTGAAFMMDGATDPEKPERYSMVVDAWARLDPKAASSWLDEQGTGPELDRARTSLVKAISTTDPAQAMNRATAITDADLRFSATGTAYRELRKKDAAAADQALDDSGLTAEQVQKLRAEGLEPPIPAP
jgi:hypothetical protein